MIHQILMTFLNLIFYNQVGQSTTQLTLVKVSEDDDIFINEIPLLFVNFSIFLVPNTTEPDYKSKDWVFLNYTYKRFEGLTQRGSIPTYVKAGKL